VGYFYQIVDIGGSMLIHSFGAYFGLAVASVIDKRKAREPGSVKEGSSYHSDVFAMIGTIFLWMFWPSFNGGLAEGSIRHRTIINTYYSLSACVVSTFIFSSFFDDKRRFNMTHVQNAALAGGVAIGNVADLMIQPWGAILIGFIAGFISVLGYVKIQPIITNRLKLHDTCGVHNLHGMPGVFGAIAGIVAIAVLSDNDYGENLYSIFAARSPDEEDRSREEQAGYQIAALLVTLVIAIVGGMITGFIANISLFDPVLDEEDDLFEDDRLWEVSDELSFNLEDRIREIVRNRSNSFHLDYKQTQSSV
jgi:ammonium transporter Rh